MPDLVLVDDLVADQLSNFVAFWRGRALRDVLPHTSTAISHVTHSLSKKNKSREANEVLNLCTKTP